MILIETILLLVVFRIAELIIVLHSAFVLQRCSGFVLFGLCTRILPFCNYNCKLLLLITEESYTLLVRYEGIIKVRT